MQKTTTKSEVVAYLVEDGQLVLHSSLSQVSDIYVEILRIDGTVIYNRMLGKRDYLDDRIDISKIPNGLYYLKVSVNGDAVLRDLFNKKFVAGF